MDDEESFHESVAGYLCAYRVFSCYSGWQARESLDMHEVDVALIDTSLPDTTGLELAAEIAARDEAPAVVVISTDAATEDVVRAVRAGAFDFVEKKRENYSRLPGCIERAATLRLGSQDDNGRPWPDADDAGAIIGDALRSCGAVMSSAVEVDPLIRRVRRRQSTYRVLRDYFEELLVRVAVERCEGNKRAASRMLGVSYSTVIKKYRRIG